MSLIAKSSGNGSEHEPIPRGPQHAVCAFVEDIGTHEGSYQGKPIQRHQCVVVWELSEKMTLGENAGKPFMISKFYTVSLNEKATLRKDLESWRGRAFTDEELNGFDLERLIGVNCMLNIVDEVKQDRTYAKIAAVMPTIKGLPQLTRFNQMAPAWIEKKRSESIEAKESGASVPASTATDELPF